MAYCTNCGTEYGEGQKFCGNCGRPVEDEKRDAATLAQEARESQEPSLGPPP